MKRILPPWSKEVKKALIDNDMSVTELSEDVGLGREYVSRVVNGTVYAPEIAERISKRLEIETEYANII